MNMKRCTEQAIFLLKHLQKDLKNLNSDSFSTIEIYSSGNFEYTTSPIFMELSLKILSSSQYTKLLQAIESFHPIINYSEAFKYEISLHLSKCINNEAYAFVVISFKNTSKIKIPDRTFYNIFLFLREKYASDPDIKIYCS